MAKQILILVLGVILGFGLFFVFNLTTPSKSTEVLNTSAECGVVTPFKYCGSNEYLCTVNCNICGCDKPVCNPLPNCTP